jgi:hypothetical protein
MWAYGMQHHEKTVRCWDKWANPRSHGFDRRRKARARREAREEIMRQLEEERAYFARHWAFIEWRYFTVW